MNRVELSSGYFLTSDGAKIYYEIRGSGQPLILVYGIACLINHWTHQIRLLSTHFRVITFDLRGHVKSHGGRPERLNIEGLAEDLYELTTYLQLTGGAHFAGHSMGVPIVVEFASRYPDRVRSLSLINGFITNPLGYFTNKKWFHKMIPLFYELNQEDPKAIQEFWGKMVDNPVAIFLSGATGGFNLNLTDLKDVEIYARGVAHLNLEVFLPLFESLISFDGTKSASKIKAPTLIVGGESDKLTPLKYQIEIKDCIDNAQLTTIPYGSHCCQLDFPEYVSLLIKNHISN